MNKQNLEVKNMKLMTFAAET